MWVGARGARSRFVAGVAYLVLLLGAGAVLAWVLRDQGMELAADWAQVLSVPLAIAASLIGWWRAGAGSRAPSTPDQVDLAERRLADLVLQQWQAEIRLRQLDVPAPPRVRWRLTELDVMDHAKNVLSSNPLSFFLLGWGRLRFSGTSDRVDRMVEWFRKLGNRRLVVLGEPGMGKTTLAVLLVRELLKTRSRGEPVPVLVTLSGWDPEQQPFQDWLTRRIGETYPALRRADFGSGAPDALVSGQRILPVLDGLDELPQAVRSRSAAALNSALAAGDQLILTCRTDEYVAAVTAPDGDVIAGGAVIEPMPLRPGDVAAYLERCVPPGRAGWPRVLRQLKAEPESVLGRALSTPLALWLLRKVYVDGHREPSPLLDTVAFPTPDSITDHLLDHLVEAVVGAEASRRRWKPADVARWLGFLAAHLEALDTRDLARWQLGERGSVRLFVRRRVPLRLRTFLEDMHGLGLLRQVGPVYQFRHAMLQDRLAAAYRAGRMG